MKYCSVFLILLLFLSVGCGQKNLPPDLPVDQLYERGLAELEDGDTQKAIDLFQRILYEYPGSEYIEKARYKLADAYYESGDYLLAANEYERFSREFPLNHLADDALYRAAFSHERMSDSYTLDQAETKKALTLYEKMNEQYQGSIHADSASIRAYLLRDRLARKAFENGYFYYKRKFYDSAIIYFETMTGEFETSSWLAPAFYYLAKSYEKLKLSEEAREARMKLLEKYPLTVEAMEVMVNHPELLGEESKDSENLQGGGAG